MMFWTERKSRLNVGPDFSANDARNGRVAHVIGGCERDQGLLPHSVQATDGDDVVLTQSRVPLLAPPSLTPLHDHVESVSLSIPEPQVSVTGIFDPIQDVDSYVVIADAGRIIAPGTRVADVLIRRRPVAGSDEPGYPVHPLIAPAPFTIGHRQALVSETLSLPLSNPARPGLIDARPEEIGSGLSCAPLRGTGAARLGAIPAAIPAEGACAGREQHPAAQTRTLNVHREASLPGVTPRPAQTGAGLSCVNFTTSPLVGMV